MCACRPTAVGVRFDDRGTARSGGKRNGRFWALRSPNVPSFIWSDAAEVPQGYQPVLRTGYTGRMTTETGSDWIDAKTWKDRWEGLEELTGGGQGEAFRAKRLHDGRPGFLKVIKSSKDLERRKRFYREASAYSTFQIDGVPKLIESNADRHSDVTYRPFLATEFIEGPTLRKWRDGRQGVSPETAFTIVDRLLEIVEACHRLGCVHRDIKPDNMIIENGDPGKVWLLDFGLNYHDLAEADFQTEDWQEVGNRFLRLPELSAGSKAKQDPRSDISFAGGILFYLLTGMHPDVLEDQDGRMPHQRSEGLARLQAAAGRRFAALAVVFDNCFASRIERRFSNVAAMRDALARVLAPPATAADSKANLVRIDELLSGGATRAREQSARRMTAASDQVSQAFGSVSSELSSKLVQGQTGYMVEAGGVRNTLFWNLLGTSETVVSITYAIVETGDEIVVSLSGQTVYRTSIDDPNYGDAFMERIRSAVTTRIVEALEDPNSALPEADYFMEVRPHGTLKAAAEQAKANGRHVLAFVYDPAQPERSRLDHALRYFLQNRKTRDAMNAAFVTALIPISQILGVTGILEGKSMEEARWIVFDAALDAKEEARVYANPSQGEVDIERLAARYAGA